MKKFNEMYSTCSYWFLGSSDIWLIHIWGVNFLFVHWTQLSHKESRELSLTATTDARGRGPSPQYLCETVMSTKHSSWLDKSKKNGPGSHKLFTLGTNASSRAMQECSWLFCMLDYTIDKLLLCLRQHWITYWSSANTYDSRNASIHEMKFHCIN